jgi:hypothetical protein
VAEFVFEQRRAEPGAAVRVQVVLAALRVALHLAELVVGPKETRSR